MASYEEKIENLKTHLREAVGNFEREYIKASKSNSNRLANFAEIFFENYRKDLESAYRSDSARLFNEHFEENAKSEAANVEKIDEANVVQIDVDVATTENRPLTTPPNTPTMRCFWCQSAPTFDGLCLTKCPTIGNVHPTRIALVLKAE